MIVCENHAIVEDIYVALPLLIPNDVIWLAILISVIPKELALILQRCAILPHCCDGKMNKSYKGSQGPFQQKHPQILQFMVVKNK